MKTEAISLTESKRLIHLEKIIKNGERTFVEVGTALAEIRDAKLYKADYSTFEEYCLEKWGWGRNRGYELILAAEVVKSLPEKCNQKITNEHQAAAISKIPPRRREAVLNEVASEGKVTAKAIAAKIPPRQKPAAPEIHVEKDEVGSSIPDVLLPFWQRRYEVDQIIQLLQSVKRTTKAAHENGDDLIKGNLQAHMLTLENLIGEYRGMKPHALCPDCRGKIIEQCTTCKHSGFVSQFVWNVQTAKEKKDVILKANSKK